MRRLVHNPDLGLLIFRLYVGFSMALAFGMAKLPPPEQMITGVEALGFPMPYFFAWCAALSEFLGGILIAVGLYTRYAALFLGFTMSVAAFMAHANDPFNVKALPLMFLVSCILLIFTGAGRFSLDSIVRKR